MDDIESAGPNFWPAFADMLLALVLVLCLALFMVAATIALGTANLKQVQANQLDIIDAIAKDFGVPYRPIAAGTYGLFLNGGAIPDIAFHNDLNSQRISFSGHLLFASEDIMLQPAGLAVLRKVGERLRSQLSVIREIQIQGHADDKRTQRFGSNLELAGQRAIVVFDFLHRDLGIDPAQHLMSVTSFGEYLSVSRSTHRGPYSASQLANDNADDERRGRNRRIELIVIYRR